MKTGKIDEFQKMMEKELYKIYDEKKIKSREALVEFIDAEDMVLSNLQSRIYLEGKKAALADMEAEGITYANLVWTRKIDRNTYKRIWFKLTRDEISVVDIPENAISQAERKKVSRASVSEPADAENVKIRKISGGAIGGVGVAITASSIIFNPSIKVLLMLLGIFTTVGGVFILTTSKKDKIAKNSELDEPEEEGFETGRITENLQQKYINRVIRKQREQNIEVLHDWCRVLRSLAENMVEEEKKKEETEG